jgi:DNA-binding HxlR family transcriptional regulator
LLHKFNVCPCIPTVRDIQESIPGITLKVLAKELKDLEQHQLIKRTVVSDYPVKITFTHEPYADTLTPIIYTMKDWGISHRKRAIGTQIE